MTFDFVFHITTVVETWRGARNGRRKNAVSPREHVTVDAAITARDCRKHFDGAFYMANDVITLLSISIVEFSTIKMSFTR